MATLLSILFIFFPAMVDDVPEVIADQMPVCQNEDGNPDGKPCIWYGGEHGPEGRWYVDSSVYR
ncbi:hypothetical protein SEA_ANON_93 [Gordonia phage Anon]|nr:hypothetical protein SEA_ANON_93 [Gordonia phage Anon]